MNPFWSDGNAAISRLRGAEPETAAAQADWAATGAPLLSQVEARLGEGSEPDAAFFMESWTIGVDAASSNFLQRQEESKERERAGSTFAYTPFFVMSVEAPVESLWPSRQERPAMNDEVWLCGEEAEETRDTCEPEMMWPWTTESACRVLGVEHAGSHQEIRSAYRKLASRYHPDRVARRGVDALKRASERMASINEAYRLLSAELVERS